LTNIQGAAMGLAACTEIIPTKKNTQQLNFTNDSFELLGGTPDYY
jgi:hypothetical protein